LGSYHVVRTPGSSNGTLAQQLAYWVAYQDAQTPWWRTWPNWIMQVDAEVWPYDNVSPATVLQFAAQLAGSGLPGWKVTYASRGQYGDSLRGLATPLWNADYRGGPGYPGDGWVSYDNTPAGWAPYSGQTPVILQYTSTPYDLNAYRGSLDELLALTAGTAAAKPSEELMGVIAVDGNGQYYHCIGGISYPVAAANVPNIRYLASQGVYELAVGPGNNPEWTDGGQTRLGWSEAIFGPVYKPLIDPAGIAAALTPEQLAAIGTATADRLAELVPAAPTAPEIATAVNDETARRLQS
jgi:hypothetical protein